MGVQLIGYAVNFSVVVNAKTAKLLQAAAETCFSSVMEWMQEKRLKLASH